jgi:hypothetical protein
VGCFVTKQSGFLSIVALILIMVMGLMGTIFASMFFGETFSGLYLEQSDQAYYLAVSGLEVAKHNMVNNELSCANITGASPYTNYSLGKGAYTVTGTSQSAASTLSSAITSSATTIALASSSGFASQGIAIIDSETIYYGGISGNSLTTVTRGINSTAATHTSGSAVSQNDCLLTATGGVPSLTNPNGGRTLTVSLPLASSGLSLTFGSTVTNPTLVSSSGISLAANAIVSNPAVTSSSSTFTGANLITSGSVILNGSSITEINSTTGIVTSSSSGNIKGDVWESVSSINSSNLFGYYFNKSSTQVMSDSNQTYTASNINGVTGKMIWTSDISLNSGTVIGSAASPVILIVNGNLGMQTNNVIYGLVFVFQGLSMNNNSSIIGAAASVGTVNISATSSVTYNASVLANASKISSDANIKGTTVGDYAAFQESF